MKIVIRQFDVTDDETKKNDELLLEELQRISLACCNISLYASHKFSMGSIIAFSMERIFAFSIERILVRNSLQLHRNFGVPLAFPKCSISRSICVPVTRSLLGYFCPVLYAPSSSTSEEKNIFNRRWVFYFFPRERLSQGDRSLDPM